MAHLLCKSRGIDDVLEVLPRNMTRLWDMVPREASCWDNRLGGRGCPAGSVANSKSTRTSMRICVGSVKDGVKSFLDGEGLAGARPSCDSGGRHVLIRSTR